MWEPNFIRRKAPVGARGVKRGHPAARGAASLAKAVSYKKALPRVCDRACSFMARGLAAEHFKCLNQAIHFVIGANSNPQKVIKRLRIKVTHQNSAFA